MAPARWGVGCCPAPGGPLKRYKTNENQSKSLLAPIETVLADLGALSAALGMLFAYLGTLLAALGVLLEFS